MRSCEGRLRCERRRWGQMGREADHRIGAARRGGHEQPRQKAPVGFRFCQPCPVVADQQMRAGCVLLDMGKAADRVAEDIVGRVVVHGRDFVDQDIAALAPEGIPVTGHQGDAFGGREFQFFTSGKVTGDAAFVVSKASLIVGAEKRDHLGRPAAIDDVPGFEHMGVHRRVLILFRDQPFFGVAKGGR